MGIFVCGVVLVGEDMMLKKWKKWKILVFCMLIITVTILSFGCDSGGSNGGTNGGQLPAPGRQAPDFSLNNLNGEEISLKDFRGHPVMLNFWATWCYPCRFEMPFIQEIYEDPDWKDTGLVIVAVNMGESRDDVEGFMSDNDLSFEVLLDSAYNIAQAYNIRSIPTTLFIDKDGIIDHIDIGPFPSVRAIEERLLSLVFKSD